MYIIFLSKISQFPNHSIIYLVRVSRSPLDGHQNAAHSHPDADGEEDCFYDEEPERDCEGFAVFLHDGVHPVVAQTVVLELEDVEESDGDLGIKVALEHGVIEGHSPVSSVENHEANRDQDEAVEERFQKLYRLFFVEHDACDVGYYVEEIEKDQAYPRPVASLLLKSQPT